MNWDYQKFRVTTEGISDDIAYSPVLRISSECEILVDIKTTTPNSNTISVQRQQSVDGVNWITDGSAVTAALTSQNLPRRRYLRWAVTNSTGTPTWFVFADITVRVFAENSLYSDNANVDPHTYGDLSVLKNIDSGDMMMLGDSISNVGSTLFHSWNVGHTLFARPKNWHRFHIHAGSAGSTLGSYCQATGNEDTTYDDKVEDVRPGRAQNYQTAFNGEHCSLHHRFRTQNNNVSALVDSQLILNRVFGNAAPAAGYLYKTNPTSTSASDKVIPYKNADGSDFFTAGSIITGGCFFQTRLDGEATWPDSSTENDHDGLTDPRLQLTKETTGLNPEFASGGDNDLLADYPNDKGIKTYKITSSTKEFDATEANVNLAVNKIGLRWRPKTGGSHSDKDGFAVFGSFFEKGNSGFSVSYSGYGGWKFGNHAYPYGDSRVPSVIGDNAAYSDQAFVNWVQVNGTKTFFVYLGSNNLWSSEANVAINQADFDALILRLRTLCPTIKIVLVGTSSTDKDDDDANTPPTAAATKVRRDNFFRSNKSKADVFIDLQGFLDTQFDFTNIGGNNPSNPWKSDYCQDDVHPNYKGIEVMALFFWSRVANAQGNV